MTLNSFSFIIGASLLVALPLQSLCWDKLSEKFKSPYPAGILTVATIMLLILVAVHDHYHNKINSDITTTYEDVVVETCAITTDVDGNLVYRDGKKYRFMELTEDSGRKEKIIPAKEIVFYETCEEPYIQTIERKVIDEHTYTKPCLLGLRLEKYQHIDILGWEYKVYLPTQNGA